MLYLRSNGKSKIRVNGRRWIYPFISLNLKIIGCSSGVTSKASESRAKIRLWSFNNYISKKTLSDGNEAMPRTPLKLLHDCIYGHGKQTRRPLCGLLLIPRDKSK